MRKLFGIMLLLAGLCAWAQSESDKLAQDVRNLTPEEQAQIRVMAENLKLKRGAVSPEKLRNYAEVGKAIAEGLGAAAKELNVAVDEFAKSDVGRVTILLIVWKVAGRDLARIATGIFLLAVLLPLWLYIFRRMCLVKSITKPEKGDKIITYFNATEVSAERFVMAVFGVGILVGSCLLMFV